MEISIKKNHGYYLIFKSDNVHVEEDVEERIYPKGEDGKINFKAPPVRDIKEEYMDMFAILLEDMAYYRKGDYNSSSLIKTLFEKLPQDSVAGLLKELNRSYGED